MFYKKLVRGIGFFSMVGSFSWKLSLSTASSADAPWRNCFPTIYAISHHICYIPPYMLSHHMGNCAVTLLQYITLLLSCTMVWVVVGRKQCNAVTTNLSTTWPLCATQQQCSQCYASSGLQSQNQNVQCKPKETATGCKDQSIQQKTNSCQISKPGHGASRCSGDEFYLI